MKQTKSFLTELQMIFNDRIGKEFGQNFASFHLNLQVCDQKLFWERFYGQPRNIKHATSCGINMFFSKQPQVNAFCLRGIILSFVRFIRNYKKPMFLTYL